jgi:hypothetical protein
LRRTYNGVNTVEIGEYLLKNEYSYRRAKQCAFLQLQYPETWKATIAHRRQEIAVSTALKADDLIKYIKEGYNPETLIGNLLTSEQTLKDYGKCTEIAGSLWAFLGSALYKAPRTTAEEEE